MHVSSTPDKNLINVLNDPVEIQDRYHAMVASANHQIMLFLPTTTAYRREEKIGIFESLELAALRGVDVRILVPNDEEIEQRIHQRIQLQKDIEIRKIKAVSSSEARTKILVIDKKEYLVVELKDDSKETFVEAVGSSIYSNSKSTVLSYMTMFDSLWNQAKLYEKLEEHSRMQKDFLNMAAHELRTPTQSILGYSELLSKFPGDNDAGKMMEALNRNALRLQYLISDILDVARIESNSMAIAYQELDLEALIRDAVEDTDRQTGDDAKDIEISYSIEQALGDEKALAVYGDETKVAQVFTNLLDNALKFTKEGGIHIGAQTKDGQAHISIRDSGSGIDKSVFPRLFEKFASKSEKGIGLGLFITRSIVEAHGGRIWAENNADGRGATFTFTLPLSPS